MEGIDENSSEIKIMENQIEIFTSIENQIVVQVRFDHDTVWLNQKQLGELLRRTLILLVCI